VGLWILCRGRYVANLRCPYFATLWMLKQGTLAVVIRGERRRVILALLQRGVYEGGESPQNWQSREELRMVDGELPQYVGTKSPPDSDTMAWLLRRRLIKSRLRKSTQKTVPVKRLSGIFHRHPRKELLQKEVPEYCLSAHGLGYALLFRDGTSVVPKPVTVPRKKGMLLKEPINDLRFEGSLVELPTITLDRHRDIKKVEFWVAHIKRGETNTKLVTIRRKFYTKDSALAKKIEDLSLYCHILVSARASENAQWEMVDFQVKRKFGQFSPMDKNDPTQLAYILRGKSASQKKYRSKDEARKMQVPKGRANAAK
jgi:hypothetical protein